MPLQEGVRLGPYQIVAPLGSGGMATVYKAFEPGIDRYVALKVLPPEFLHDPSFAERFQREARFVGRLEHPNVVPLYAHGIDDGLPWMAMRLVGGGTLAARLGEGRLSPAHAVDVVRGVAAALDYAHAQGIVHRDIKPHNVLLDPSGHVYLSDFGVARLLHGSAPSGVSTSAGQGVVGTPWYMAPEQASGDRLDHRCDVYSLGVVAYELLSGRVPFAGDTPVKVLMKHVMDSVPVPPPAVVPRALIQPVLRALAKRPAERWATAGELASALERGLAQAALTLEASVSNTLAPAVPDVGDAPTIDLRPMPAGPGSPPPSGRSSFPRRLLAGADYGRAWRVAAATTLATGLLAALATSSATRARPSSEAEAGAAPNTDVSGEMALAVRVAAERRAAERSAEPPAAVEGAGDEAPADAAAVGPAGPDVSGETAPAVGEPAAARAAVESAVARTVPAGPKVPGPPRPAAASKDAVARLVAMAPDRTQTSSGRLKAFEHAPNPDFNGQLELDVSPRELKVGEAYTVRVFVHNTGQLPMKLKDVVATTRVNAQPGPKLRVDVKAREVAVAQRLQVAEIHGTWQADVGSWSMEAKIVGERGDACANRVVYRKGS